MMKAAHVVLAITIFTIWLGARSAPDKSLTTEQKLAEVFAEWNRSDRPGGAVVVVKDGQVAFRKNYGLANLEWNVPVDDRTVFDAVAIARPMTAMAVAILEEQGLLSADDKVSRHIPEWPAALQDVPVRHLLFQTSGVRDWRVALAAAGWRPADLVTTDNLLWLVGRQREAEFAPGSLFKESETNYDLLAEIVRRATKRSLSDWTWENLFRPLRMTRSFFAERVREPIENRAQAYIYSPKGGYRQNADNIDVAGSGGFFTTADDLGKWLINLGNPKAVAPTVAAKLLSSGTLADGASSPYGYGLKQDEFHGLRRLQASGQQGGYSATLQYFPDQKFGVAILCNWVSGWVDPQRDAGGVVRIFLGDAWRDEAPAPALKIRKKIKPTWTLMRQYAGVFRFGFGSLLTVRAEAGGLTLQGLGNSPIPLEPDRSDGFAMPFPGARVDFKRGNDGRIARLILDLFGDVTDAPFIVLVRPTAGELADFAGVYQCPELEARYTVSLQDGKLWLSHPRLGRVVLEPEAQDHFTCGLSPFRLIAFGRDDGRRVTGFKAEDLSFVFARE